MKIQIYGTGCPKCRELENRALAAARAIAPDAVIEKISDLRKIADAGVMMTPALGIDGKVVSSGRLPEIAEITSLIATRLAEGEAGDAS